MTKSTKQRIEVGLNPEQAALLEALAENYGKVADYFEQANKLIEANSELFSRCLSEPREIQTKTVNVSCPAAIDDKD
jgi:hypothetical protein